MLLHCGGEDMIAMTVRSEHEFCICFTMSLIVLRFLRDQTISE